MSRDNEGVGRNESAGRERKTGRLQREDERAERFLGDQHRKEEKMSEK